VNHQYRWTLVEGVYGSVANAVANLSEDIAGSQLMLDESLSGDAKSHTEESVRLFKERMRDAGVDCEVTPSCELGKIVVRITGEHFDLRLQARRFV
jgi:hypothetical protein